MLSTVTNHSVNIICNHWLRKSNKRLFSIIGNICFLFLSSLNFAHRVFEALNNMDQDLAMFLAIEDDDPAALRELLRVGAEPDTYCFDMNNIPSKSMVHIACQKGNLECLKILVEYGGSLEAPDRWGHTSLMYSITSGYVHITKYLIDTEPGLVKISDQKGNTPLHCAVQMSCIETIQMLLQVEGVDINRGNLNGITPLMFACTLPTSELPRSLIVNCLLEAGADVNLVENKAEKTALHLAVLAKDANVLEVILQAGADPNSLDRGGRTALTNCLLENIIVPKAPGSMPIMDDNILSMIILLTTAGTNMNLSLCEYSHPLICASFVGSLQLVKFFMDNGSCPDLASNCFPSGVTPILTAASRNQINIVKHFIGWGCKINKKGRISRKQMDYIFDCFELAIFLKYWDLAKLLLNAGYPWKPNQIDKDNDLRESLQSSEEMTDWYNSFVRTPQSLVSYSIVTIRESLGSKIPSKYEKLQLPKSINDKILLKELLSLDES